MESIFVSALRSFFRAFFAVCGILLGLVIFSFVYAMFTGTGFIEEKTTMTILSDASGKRMMVSPTAPAILQLNIHGPIGIDRLDLSSETVENILIESRMGMLSHDRVKGILLHINTPGGTVVDSDNIYRMLQQYKERYQVPVFAYVDGLCASGGMYIASAADQIFASPSSAIGSVGVIYGPFMNVYQAMGKIGVEAKTLTEGIDKDTLNPMRPWKEGEDQWIKDILAFSYDRFLTVVTTGRARLTKDLLIHTLGARMFNCETAQKLGYVDHAMSSREEALLALCEQVQIDPGHPYQVVELSPKRNWLSGLVNGTSPLVSGKVEHGFAWEGDTKKAPFSYLYQAK